MFERRLTDDQVAFLATFADNYRMGRRLLCSVAHILATIGGIATAIGAVIGLVHLSQK